MSQAELARRIGARQSALVALFGDDSVQSRLVPAIHQALGLKPPTMTVARAA